MKAHLQPVQPQSNSQNTSPPVAPAMMLTEQELRAIAGAGLMRNHNETMIDAEELPSAPRNEFIH